MNDLVTLALKIPRNTEVTPESAQTFLAALTQVNFTSGLQKLMGTKPKAFALELALINQQIYFLITCDAELVPFIETQIQSNYPLAIIEKIKDPLRRSDSEASPLRSEASPLSGIAFDMTILKLSKGSYYPIATTAAFQEVDPLSSILSVLAKSDPDEVTLVQFALESTDSRWQGQGALYAQKGTKNEDGSYSDRSDANVIKEKISYPGFHTSIRIISNTKNTLNELSSAFGVFNRSDGNSFSARRPTYFNRDKEKRFAINRLVSDRTVLNILELATLWHLPSEKIKIPSIVWGTSVLSEPPNNLPVALGLADEERKHINFF